jgi:hypothetical protein
MIPDDLGAVTEGDTLASGLGTAGKPLASKLSPKPRSAPEAQRPARPVAAGLEPFIAYFWSSYPGMSGTPSVKCAMVALFPGRNARRGNSMHGSSSPMSQSASQNSRCKSRPGVLFRTSSVKRLVGRVVTVERHHARPVLAPIRTLDLAIHLGRSSADGHARRNNRLAVVQLLEQPRHVAAEQHVAIREQRPARSSPASARRTGHWRAAWPSASRSPRPTSPACRRRWRGIRSGGCKAPPSASPPAPGHKSGSGA